MTSIERSNEYCVLMTALVPLHISNAQSHHIMSCSIQEEPVTPQTNTIPPYHVMVNSGRTCHTSDKYNPTISCHGQFRKNLSHLRQIQSHHIMSWSIQEEPVTPQTNTIPPYHVMVNSGRTCHTSDKYNPTISCHGQFRKNLSHLRKIQSHHIMSWSIQEEPVTPQTNTIPPYHVMVNSGRTCHTSDKYMTGKLQSSVTAYSEQT